MKKTNKMSLFGVSTPFNNKSHQKDTWLEEKTKPHLKGKINTITINGSKTHDLSIAYDKHIKKYFEKLKKSRGQFDPSNRSGNSHNDHNYNPQYPGQYSGNTSYTTPYDFNNNNLNLKNLDAQESKTKHANNQLTTTFKSLRGGHF